MNVLERKKLKSRSLRASQLMKINCRLCQVRWQHEDDVSECNSCKTGLQKTKKKDNCRHCGRIFCHDCLPKKVLYLYINNLH